MTEDEVSITELTLDSDQAESDEDLTSLNIPEGKRKVSTDKLDTPVKTLVQDIREGTLDLQPSFQRHYVWNGTKPSRLIESILLEIPLPVIYLAEESDGTQVVVDGQQRLTTIRSFVDGKFPNDQKFKLYGLQVLTELNGKTFADLDRVNQEKIKNTSLRIIMVKQDSHPDVKFEVFERLNLGAEKLKDQELRNCMYRGPFNNLLHDLAANSKLRTFLGLSAPDVRMRDCELVLRFIAMYQKTHLHFKKPLKQFLNRAMAENQNITDPEAARLRAMFEKAIDIAYTVFGDKAFRIYHPSTSDHQTGRWDNKISVSLWDTLLYTFAFYEKSQIVPVADSVREEFLDVLHNDSTFAEYLASQTDAEDRVRYRADTWRRRVDALVAGVGSQGPRSFSLNLKQQLFETNSTCALCGQRIHALDDSEVDHIEHYWRGGRTIDANARLAHRYCNRSRGGR